MRVLRACRPCLPRPERAAHRKSMADIPPALRAAMDEYARAAADEAPTLTDEQICQLRAALRRDAWDRSFAHGDDPGPVPGDTLDP